MTQPAPDPVPEPGSEPGPVPRCDLPTSPPGAGGSYRENVRAPWWMWLLGTGFALCMSAVFLPLGRLGALAGLLGAAGLAIWGILRWTLVIELADGVLRVGRARVPVSVIGEVRSLDQAGMRTERGPRLDARAFLAIRGWSAAGVRIALCDPDDPTPYWLVSTAAPVELAAAIRAAAAESRAGGAAPR